MTNLWRKVTFRKGASAQCCCREMTPDEQRAFEEAFQKMDDGFAAMSRAFDALSRTQGRG